MAARGNLDKILEDLNKSSNIRASAIVSRDGVTLKSNNSQEVSGETLAAMSASMFNGTEMVLSEMMNGTLNRTITESRENRLIVMNSGSAALLVVVTDTLENLDSILKKMDKTSEKIREVLG